MLLEKKVFLHRQQRTAVTPSTTIQMCVREKECDIILLDLSYRMIVAIKKKAREVKSGLDLVICILRRVQKEKMIPSW